MELRFFSDGGGIRRGLAVASGLVGSIISSVLLWLLSSWLPVVDIAEEVDASEEALGAVEVLEALRWARFRDAASMIKDVIVV